MQDGISSDAVVQRCKVRVQDSCQTSEVELLQFHTTIVAGQFRIDSQKSGYRWTNALAAIWTVLVTECRSKLPSLVWNGFSIRVRFKIELTTR